MKPELPPVKLTEEQIEAYHRDGAICVRGLYSPEWVAKLTDALDEICDSPSPIAQVNKNAAINRADLYTWQMYDAVRDFVLFGPTAHIVQQVFGSEKVNFFFDQIFIKEALTTEGTPWHHDATYWSLRGDQIASIWTSVDPVTVETSALEFIAGSHRWGKEYQAVGLRPGDVLPGTEHLEHLPDIDGNRKGFDILSWDLNPGDGLLFHALTLHGSRGNSSPYRKRRAITTRWCGDDVTFARKGAPVPWAHGLNDGDPLDGPVFPRVWPTLDETAIAARMKGPILPDLDIVRRFGAVEPAAT